MKKIIEKTNGYKTLIGFTLLVASTVLPLLVDFLGEMGADPKYAAWTGFAIMVVGALHKAWKRFYARS